MAVISRLREVAVDRRRNHPDRILFGTMLALSGLGLLMIYSATSSTAGSVGMERQMIFVAAGLIVYLVVSNIDYREWRPIIPMISIIILIALLAVFLFAPVNGSQRWIPLGFFKLQPAEFAKVVVILALASLLSPNREEIGRRSLSWPTVLKALAIVGVPAVLIYKEPDLGTTLVFGFILIVMLFVAGGTWRQIVALISGAALAIFLALQRGWLADYQLDRIRVLFDSTIDPQGIGYNLRQSKFAIGSGQLFGKGLFAAGTQTSFQYVPEQETDFIFTALGEQLGFIGAILVLAAFAVIIWRLLVIAANARDRFGALVATGLAAMLFFHVFVNVGMTIGIMPVTGLPLPFLSSGGSFYLAMTLALGIANSIWLMRTPVPGENQLS
jgi:rod shape determining protein RodA